MNIYPPPGGIYYPGYIASKSQYKASMPSIPLAYHDLHWSLQKHPCPVSNTAPSSPAFSRSTLHVNLLRSIYTYFNRSLTSQSDASKTPITSSGFFEFRTHRESHVHKIQCEVSHLETSFGLQSTLLALVMRLVSIVCQRPDPTNLILPHDPSPNSLPSHDPSLSCRSDHRTV